MLRTEGPILGEYRLAIKTTELGGVHIPAGTQIFLSNGAANRDPRQFECPAEFRATRENVRRHIAFGHGIHTCPGAPLARSETRITVERLQVVRVARRSSGRGRATTEPDPWPRAIPGTGRVARKPVLLGDVAAVDRQRHPGDVRGVVAGEEHGGGGDLARRP